MLKYIACGDPQGDTTQTLKVVQFANSIPANQLDFVVYCGDIMGAANTITQNSSKPFYLVQGNHDGSNFGPQYYPDVKGHQIVIPQFNWQSYNWAQVDKTKPCLVFVHCPPIPCSSCDSLHKCGQTMRAAQLDKLNMRACHSGHLHGHKVDILAPTTGAPKRLYVVESGMPNRTTCCSPNFRNQVGYVRIDDAGNVCYKELDITLSWTSQTVNGEVVFDPSRCTGATPVMKYRCTGSPDFQCVLDPNGTFNSLAECQTACQKINYRCSGAPDFQCIVDPNGPFTSLAECQSVCKPTVTKYRCTGCPDFECIQDPNGTFNSLAECQASCKQPSLQTVIENVTSSIGFRYQTRDSANNVTDTIKIIQNPVDNITYLGVYHTLISGTFRIKLGTSTDLKNWTYKVDLDNNSSQPYITSLSDGGFLVAMEATAPNLHLRFKYYANLNRLFTGTADRIFDAPRTIPNAGAEGTPNIYSAILSPDIDNSVIDIGFHYFENSNVDKQARGTLTNFSQWTTHIETQVNAAIMALGVQGNIGDRDNVIFNGISYNIIEGQLVKGNWASWRCFLYNWSTNTAVQLNIKTHNGSTAFANPSITKIKDPLGKSALVVTLFLPSEGAATGEAGELIYYSCISETTKKYRCTGSPDFQCIEDPNGPFNSLTECQDACKPIKYACSGEPDFQCIPDPNGPFNTLAECQAACKPAKYRCTGSPDFQCVLDPNGPFNSLAECLTVCKPVKYRCSGAPDFQCIVDPNGPFNTLAECQIACQPQIKKFDVFTVGDPNNPSGVLVIKGTTYTASEACQVACNILNTIN